MPNKKRHSIKNRLIIIFSITTVVAMSLVSGIFYLYFSSYIRKNIRDNNLQIVKQLGQNIERNLKYMSDISFLTAYDQNVLQFITGDSKLTERERLDNEFRIKTQMGNLLAYSGIAEQINIYNLKTEEIIGINRNNIFEASKKLNQEEWYETVISENSYKTTFIDVKDNGDVYYCAALKIVDMSSGQPIGIVVIGSPMGTIQQQIDSFDFGPKWRLQITDNKNNLVFSNNEKTDDQFLNQHINYSDNDLSDISIGDEKYLVSSIPIDSAGWTITCFIPSSFINKDFDSIIGTITMVIIGCVLLMVIIVQIISHKISEPIIDLSHKMEEVKAGNFNVHANNAGNDEIGMLSQVFNEMTDRIDKLITTTYRAELRVKEATIKSLQAQINPHFLYNTLESIRTLATLNDDYDTAVMIATLGKFLRFKISKSERFTSLENELDYVRDYIALMQMKCNNKIKFEMKIEKGLEKRKITRLVVQPIVENSIIHGFEGRQELCRISVNAYSDSGHILISVIDDGRGITKEELSALKKQLLSDNDDKSKSIGLKNVFDRIRMEFGDKYGLDIQSSPDKGTTVIVTLPDIGNIEV